VFEVPPTLLEFHREPIEEFGVGGLFALDAEVFWSADEAVAKDALPHAVN
jgi:hypothetical protein